MCGLAGVLGFTGTVADLQAATTQMCATLLHRGPDAGGIWCDAKHGVGIGHRRLSILELTQAGGQPMASESGNLMIAFNGEIYNHLELRRDLRKTDWRGNSDTESLLAAIEAWGIHRALSQAVGMFALALWDRARGELTLARDRMGEKPLYYGWSGNSFLFASECKALCNFPGWRGELDRDALCSLMRIGYVPAPHSIWKGIWKLPPATTLTISAGTLPGKLNPPIPYWRVGQVVTSVPFSPLSEVEAVQKLEGLLKQSIAGQMVADVPLGAFLSGGVDSSTVVALMQAQSARPIRTFSIGFSEDDYDESRYAAVIASHLGTDHTTCVLSPADVLAVVPSLPELYDEPFGDSSQIPTHLVSRVARRQVSVSLSGDGGDELFGGYNRYVWGRRFWRNVVGTPRAMRRAVGRFIQGVDPASWDRIGRSLPRRFRQPTLGDRLHKLASVMDVASPDELYSRLVSQQSEVSSIVIGGSERASWAEVQVHEFAAGPRGRDFTERMMFGDLIGYLPDDILVKLDRAAMSVSLESRVPMLDHRVVEFAWSLPFEMKIRANRGKWLLREVLYRHVPRQLIERPKQGFAIPIGSWLRQDLRDWAEALLDESRLRREGYLESGMVRRRWSEHLSGRRNNQHWLWNVLMFQAWQERWL